ncbi:MAG: DEAD/DEAH box helicase [Synechococcales cyanobacterium CRU_2_2]|nr:DEAD/DEAH box helicase [Synechococcales cyanobacterium CRU_2_2]
MARSTPPPASATPGELDLQKIFPFELDGFQLQAIEALNGGRSVVVCAPTGSGKTLIGEYAIYRALARGKRVMYTTPLKALSNQKLRDFQAQFGEEQVGLLTGDVSVNRDAPILVMTTEIFRNMLYGTPIGQVGTSVEGVEAVVLDECHYMNDRDRGTVWEESIIYCPPTIQIVALSATVANSDQLTDWIDQVHGPTDLIYSDFRPVPLEFSFCSATGLFPLLNESKTAIHPNFDVKRNRKGRQRRDPKGGRQKTERPEAPPLTFVVTQLQQRDMLPAIYFIFSRKGCDRAVDQAAKLSLVTPEEELRLRIRVREFEQRNPGLARPHQTEALCRGLASHHAGLLPGWKAFVEELFQEGLVKVVFATETLAAGINMPARTTVISSLSKRTNDGHRPLNASEFLQMAGRAGRRGMDTRGYMVTVQSRFEGAKEAAQLATAGADPLVSQFTPSYGMVLNLLQTHRLEEARELVERSFGRYLAMLTLKPQQTEIQRIEDELGQLQAQLEDVDWNLLKEYEKLKGHLKEERRLLKILHQQAEEEVTQEMTLSLNFAVAGTVLSLKGKNIRVSEPILAALVTKVPGPGKSPYLVCISLDNQWYIASTADVVALHGEIPRVVAVDRLTVPVDLSLRPGPARMGDEQTGEVSDRLLSLALRPELQVDPANQAEAVQAQLERVQAVEIRLEHHPVHRWSNQSHLIKRQRRLESLETELADRRQKLDRYAHHHWEAFLALIEILQHFDCLRDVEPTELGEAVSALRGDNELWLGLALFSGEFDDLLPHQFAAACEAISTEVSRPDLWTDYPMSPAVEEALVGIRGLRRQLIQQQQRRRVELPVWYELELTGLVEQWGLGIDWNELCSNTSLDEGDVVRVLRRTLDLLSQIPHVPHVSDAVRQNARRALHLMDRAPIRELVALAVDVAATQAANAAANTPVNTPANLGSDPVENPALNPIVNPPLPADDEGLE